MRDNLSRYGLAVKERFAPGRQMGIGLWLAAPAARHLQEPSRLSEFSQWLAEQGLVAFTFNGFPYGDFHEAVVKHRVYAPSWLERQRRDYTLDLIRIQHALLPPSLDGSISTLPIAWGTPALTHEQLSMAAKYLGEVADYLRELEQKTGRLITLCLEPEPGCMLQRCADVITFFNEYLCPTGRDQERKRYIRVCHDICHSAVMFEDQGGVLCRYADHGIQVGKVQVSSAIEVDFDHVSNDRRNQLTAELASFSEDRYLHQTTVLRCLDEPPVFFEDLPLALSAARRDDRYLVGKWRVHFHVPIYVERFGMLRTTQQDIKDCWQASLSRGEVLHWEVETYAWGVLPVAMQRTDLADGIADEMIWLRSLMAGIRPAAG